MTPSHMDPLPFRFRVPGKDTVGLIGFESVSYKVEGLLHLSDHLVTLEWSGTQTIEQFTFEKVGTDVDDYPHDWLELPVTMISDARAMGGWWWPRFELRARRLDAFDTVPTARGATLSLRIRRRDRTRAREMAVAIELAKATNRRTGPTLDLVALHLTFEGLRPPRNSAMASSTVAGLTCRMWSVQPQVIRLSSVSGSNK